MGVHGALRMATIRFASWIAVSVSFADGPAVSTIRVTCSFDGSPPNGESFRCSLDGSGRYVAYGSKASNLCEYDNNYKSDAFVFDRFTGSTECISITPTGTIGNNNSDFPMLSGDGRWVAFHSFAGNLVPGDTNSHCDVFMRDRLTGVTKRISVSSTGQQGNDASSYPSINHDGSRIIFASLADNLVPMDNNDAWDLFLYERESGQLTRLTHAFDGGQADRGQSAAGCSFPSFSTTGRHVAFQSSSTNLVHNDSNAQDDVFVYDLDSGFIDRASVSSAGEQGYGDRCWYPTISADGRWVAFISNSTNLVDPSVLPVGHIFLHDRWTRTTTMISRTPTGDPARGTSTRPWASDDGRYIAYHSWAPNIVEDDTNAAGDVFVFDRVSGTTRRVSLSIDGQQGNGQSWYVAMSGNGRFVAYSSFATNLVADAPDGNLYQDIFVTDLFPEMIERRPMPAARLKP